MPDYSRQNPSPRYVELLGYYRELHVGGYVEKNLPPEETFDGRSLPHHAGNIRRVAKEYNAKTILDYGSGKGRQYGPLNIQLPSGEVYPDIRSFWNVDEITCFDPGYEPFSRLPEGTFNGVVSTDVLEHCPVDDIPWIVDEMFGFAEKFVYVNVACYPAVKTLPNGENAHCTLERPDWWIAHFDAQIAKRPDLRYIAAFDVPLTDEQGNSSIHMIMHQG